MLLHLRLQTRFYFRAGDSEEEFALTPAELKEMDRRVTDKKRARASVRTYISRLPADEKTGMRKDRERTFTNIQKDISDQRREYRFT